MILIKSGLKRLRGVPLDNKNLRIEKSQRRTAIRAWCPRWRLARARARPPATRNNPSRRFSFPPSSPLRPSLSQSRLHLAASLSRCYYVYNARRGGTLQKRLIDGPRRRGAAEGSPPSSAGTGGVQRRGENAFAEQTGGMSIETTGTRRFTFLRPFLLAWLSYPSRPPSVRSKETASPPPFNTRVVRSSNSSRHQSREENFPIVECVYK